MGRRDVPAAVHRAAVRSARASARLEGREAPAGFRRGARVDAFVARRRDEALPAGPAGSAPQTPPSTLKAMTSQHATADRPVHVFTDGGHRYGAGGGAWLVDHTWFGAASFPSPSADHSELTALVLALEHVTAHAVVVHTDSTVLAVAPDVLHQRLTRRWPADPRSIGLLNRLAAAVEGRDVRIEWTASKGPDAVEQMGAVDALERLTRQVAALTGADVTLTPAQLPLDTSTTAGVLGAGQVWAATHLPGLVPDPAWPLGTSRANALLRPERD